MRNKKGNFLLKIVICLSILLIGLINSTPVYALETKYYLGGQVAGFVLDEIGANVIAITDIVTEEGVLSPAEQAGIKKGDIILSLNGNKVDKAEDIDSFLSKYEKGEIVVEILREDEKVLKNISPCRDISGKARIGLLIRDAMSGIGTVTYYTNTGEFSALGHPVYTDNNSIFKLSQGRIYSSSVIGVFKGKRGIPGEIKGAFVEKNPIGEITVNDKCGIKGKVYNYPEKDEIEIGKGEIGKAEIYCCVEGTKVSKFSVSIVKCDENNKHNKNFVIKITDDELLKKTGGIVQGMSGSPIVQDGKLIGAVTHVFINDPTRGYGISVSKLVGNK